MCRLGGELCVLDEIQSDEGGSIHTIFVVLGGVGWHIHTTNKLPSDIPPRTTGAEDKEPKRRLLSVYLYLRPTGRSAKFDCVASAATEW